MANQQISTNTFGVAKWIVSADATQGTHTTIASATTSASSGDTIWIRDGTYTEDFSAKAGVTYTCASGDGNSGNVTIVGNVTCTGVGTFTFSNLRLQTNSANCLTVSGSSATIVNLNNVYVNCTNNTGISYTTSNSSSIIYLYNCTFNLGTTGIAYYSMTSTGLLLFFKSDLQNSGVSVTASNNSANLVQFFFCNINAPLSTSSTGSVALYNCIVGANNATCITTAGTGQVNSAQNSWFASGTASAISVGSGTAFYLVLSQIVSNNTNAITGAGTLNYVALTFQGSSSKINTTTQVGGLLNGGQTQAPSSGYLGEQIRSAVASGSAVSVSVNTPTNITSISLTAGIWDVSGIIIFSTSGSGGTIYTASVNTTSATLGTAGDNSIPVAIGSGTTAASLSIPSWRVTLTATTTTYLVANYNAGSGVTAYGRISATRVG